MSLILKGIDLPQEEINLTITKDGRIYFNNKYHLIAEAIQIPKGHGRLIDADKYLYYGDLEDEPTILESEEDDEHNTERD